MYHTNLIINHKYVHKLSRHGRSGPWPLDTLIKRSHNRIQDEIGQCGDSFAWLVWLVGPWLRILCDFVDEVDAANPPMFRLVEYLDAEQLAKDSTGGS